jgi:hypothetical protein
MNACPPKWYVVNICDMGYRFLGLYFIVVCAVVPYSIMAPVMKDVLYYLLSGYMV